MDSAGEGTALSMKEADRAVVVGAVAERRLTQRQAALRLGLSVRQVKRLVRRYRAEGAAGLASGHRGRRPNNALPEAVREAALARVREKYADFGPTHACEKLVDEDGFRLSAETLRKWMIEDGQWRPKARREPTAHPPRPRRECFGDLVQIDGSPHAWFEDRGPRCTLIVFVDDATSRLTALRFAPAETTRAYMETLRGHLSAHGRPVALYSDRYGVFRNNLPGHEDEPTQFTRALGTLDIEPIHASTPQAKGRVERANRTLQSRLVREMRLRGIDGIDAGNAFAASFMEDYNARFAVAPRSPEDAHRPVLHSARELDLVLCEHHVRKLTRNLTVKFECREYQVTGRGRGYRLRGAEVTVCRAFDGGVTVLRDGGELSVRLLAEGEQAAPVEDEKTVRDRVAAAKAAQRSRPDFKPAPDHPWRRRFKTDAAADAAAG